MTVTANLDELALLDGIVPTYQDLSGQQQSTSPETKRALLKANGWHIDNDAMVKEELIRRQTSHAARILPEEIICVSGKQANLKIGKSLSWHLELEGEPTTVIEGRADNLIKLPALPSGIHLLTLETDEEDQGVRLIAAPKRAPSVLDKAGRDKIWGVNLALYGLHRKNQSGIGNYRDLGDVAKSFEAQGASFLGINPVHVMGWNNTDIISPYSPSHRGFLNTSHISVEMIKPQSERSRGLIAKWNELAKKPLAEYIDYDEHAHFHRPILQSLFEDFVTSATPEERSNFKQYCEGEGAGLRQFAEFECLVGSHGDVWEQWPQSPIDLTKTNNDLDRKIEFHSWLQWQADQQILHAQSMADRNSMGLGLYLDLAVGSRRNGAEAWANKDAIAQGVSVGAPPDHLSPAGQNWNLAAYSPRKLAAGNYRAFREILSRNMRRCGVIRIDHILGLYRSFWIPDNGAPGGYIKHNFEALLAIIRIEAERNNTVVIGEDLGLVPDGLRSALFKSGIYSYSVLQYEKNRSGSFKNASRLRSQSLACFGTHDTPTLKGFIEGEDISWWQKLGWIDEAAALKSKKQRARETKELTKSQISNKQSSEVQPSVKFEEISRLVHTELANSPVAMVSVQLDDIEANGDAQNLPGTVNEHPNWRRRAKTPIDDIANHPGLKQIGDIMEQSGRSSRLKKQRGTAT